MLTSGLRRVGRVRGRRQGSEWVRLHVRRRARHAAAAAIRRDKSQESPGSGRTAHGRVSSCGSEQGSGARRGSQAYPAISARNERQIFVASVFPAPLSPAQHTGSVGQLSAACGSLGGRAFHAPLITMDWLCFFASICSYAALVTWYACGGKAPAS